MKEWETLCENLYYDKESGLMLEYGGMGMDKAYLDKMQPKIADAISHMEALEGGAIANPDENRMVGHYWLRDAKTAPNKEIFDAIENAKSRIRDFSEAVRTGKILSEKEERFKYAMIAGIGGSSLGPAFIYDALHVKGAGLELFFLDNTDPAGMDRVFSAVGEDADRTLLIVISKSGGTIETRNAMEEARKFYVSRKLDFAKHTVCITGEGSKLEGIAKSEGWLDIFPMWDWVGGRTSVMSAVGLLPLSLAGIDVDELLKGAADCDALGRNKNWRGNPAAVMALAWYFASGGEGGESMVVLPYRDSLNLFAKYLQQLVMESLGKELDLDGKKVNQGLAVFGNKGSSDQHSYVQQLVGGPFNVFVTFVQVLKDRAGKSAVVGEESTSGDYLNAFMLGTKRALEDHGKKTMTITVPDDSAYCVGMLIALYERVVGLYAKLINVNAYHQPAVEFGKKAAGGFIELKNAAKAHLAANKGKEFTASELAAAIGKAGEEAALFRLLLHLSANDPAVEMLPAEPITASRFRG